MTEQEENVVVRRLRASLARAARHPLPPGLADRIAEAAVARRRRPSRTFALNLGAGIVMAVAFGALLAAPALLHVGRTAPPSSAASAGQGVHAAPSASPAPFQTFATCTASHLRITRQLVSSGAFQTWWIYFIQTTGSACTLQGTPGLAQRGGQGLRPISTQAVSAGLTEDAVPLQVSSSYGSFYTIEDCGNPNAADQASGTLVVTIPSGIGAVDVTGSQASSCTVDARVSPISRGTIQPPGLSLHPLPTPAP